MKKRWMTLGLLCALLLSSCSAQTETAETKVTADVQAETEAVETEPVYPGTMEDLGGYTFTFLNHADEFWSAAHQILDYEEDSGVATESAVFRRNRKAEEDLNITIAVEKDELGNLRPLMEKAILAGDDTYDVAYLCLLWSGATSFGADNVIDLMSIPTMNLDREWWNQMFIEEATVRGKLHTTVDYVNRMGFVYCNSMFFNYDMMVNMGLEIPYDHVREGTWTYDTMFSYMADVMNMGTQADWKPVLSGDAQYGYACEHEEGLLTLLQGSGQFMTVKNAEGIPTLRTDYSRISDAYDSIISGLSGDGVCAMINTTELQGVHIFLQGRAMFYPGYIGLSDTARFRDSDTRYGIIPIPKMDETQEQYHNSISSYTLAMNIPIVASDPERTGLVMDYLAFLSYQNVIPVVQEAMCYKGLRDEDSIEMLEIILETESLDFGNCTGITNGFLNSVCKDILSGNNKFVSTYTGQTKSMEGKIEKLFPKE